MFVSHHPGFIHSGADRKKESSSERPQMEEISEKEDVASSPQTPQAPQTPQTPQRPTQSADSSKGHAPPKRFLSVLFCELLTLSTRVDQQSPHPNLAPPEPLLDLSAPATNVGPSHFALGPPQQILNFNLYLSA